MKTVLIILLCMISGQEVLCADVTGYTGGSVFINCRYDHSRYMNHTKYFCKLNGGHECTEKVLSNAQSGTSHEGRFLFMDLKDHGLFSVLIKNISQGDDGTYRCGVEDKGAATTDVTLDVAEDSCCGTSQVRTVPPGQNVTFTCVYPERIKTHFKYVYKATDRSYHAVIYTLGQKDQKGRFSLSDHPQENFFNVTISDATEEDEGVYLCGAQQQQNPYVSFFNEMQLQVTDVRTFPSSIVITVCVCVSLLLIMTGLLSLILYKQRAHKTEGSVNMLTGTNNTTHGDYENDPHGNQNVRMGPAYQSLNTNTNQSDSVYQSLNHNTNQSDSVYQSLNQNTNQSDSVYQSLNPDTNQSDS